MRPCASRFCARQALLLLSVAGASACPCTAATAAHQCSGAASIAGSTTPAESRGGPAGAGLHQWRAALTSVAGTGPLGIAVAGGSGALSAPDSHTADQEVRRAAGAEGKRHVMVHCAYAGRLRGLCRLQGGRRMAATAPVPGWTRLRGSSWRSSTCTSGTWRWRGGCTSRRCSGRSGSPCRPGAVSARSTSACDRLQTARAADKRKPAAALLPGLPRAAAAAAPAAPRRRRPARARAGRRLHGQVH